MSEYDRLSKAELFWLIHKYDSHVGSIPSSTRCAELKLRTILSHLLNLKLIDLDHLPQQYRLSVERFLEISDLHISPHPIASYLSSAKELEILIRSLFGSDLTLKGAVPHFQILKSDLQPLSDVMFDSQIHDLVYCKHEPMLRRYGLIGTGKCLLADFKHDWCYQNPLTFHVMLGLYLISLIHTAHIESIKPLLSMSDLFGAILSNPSAYHAGYILAILEKLVSISLCALKSNWLSEQTSLDKLLFDLILLKHIYILAFVTHYLRALIDNRKQLDSDSRTILQFIEAVFEIARKADRSDSSFCTFTTKLEELEQMTLLGQRFIRLLANVYSDNESKSEVELTASSLLSFSEITAVLLFELSKLFKTDSFEQTVRYLTTRLFVKPPKLTFRMVLSEVSWHCEHDYRSNLPLFVETIPVIAVNVDAFNRVMTELVDKRYTIKPDEIIDSVEYLIDPHAVMYVDE